MSFDEMVYPDDWRVLSLRDIAGKPQYGWTTRARRGEGTKLLRTTDITAGPVDWGSVPVCEEPPPELSKYKLQPGDIVVSRAGSVGYSSLIDEACPDNAVFASYLVRVRPDVTLVHPRFLAHYMKSPYYWRQVGEASVGIGLANVNASKLAAMTVPLPPVREQESLVSLLDGFVQRRKAANAHLSRASRVLERFRQAVLAAAWSGQLTAGWREANGEDVGAASDLVRILKSNAESQREDMSLVPSRVVDGIPDSWQTATGFEVFPFITSGSRGWARYYSDEGPSFLRVGNLDRHRLDLDLDEVQHVEPPSNTEAKRTRVLQGDLLISITAEIGMVGIAPPTLAEAYVNQHVAIARPHPAINARFVAICVAAPNGGQKQLDVFQRGATKAGLGLDDIRSLVVPVPSAAEQAEIVQRVDQLFALARSLEERIERAELQIGRSSQAVLAKAFRGELGVPA